MDYFSQIYNITPWQYTLPPLGHPPFPNYRASFYIYVSYARQVNDSMLNSRNKRLAKYADYRKFRCNKSLDWMHDTAIFQTTPMAGISPGQGA